MSANAHVSAGGMLRVSTQAIDYRGYGASAGQPSEPGLKQDADASLAWLLARSDIDHHKLVVYGQSLGGAVAAYLAASEAGRTHVAGVIFENTFTSTINMAMSLFPFLVPLKWVLPLVVKSPWNSAAEVQSIIAPIMFVSGKLDTIVPPPHMAELHRVRARSPAGFLCVCVCVCVCVCLYMCMHARNGGQPCQRPVARRSSPSRRSGSTSSRTADTTTLR